MPTKAQMITKYGSEEAFKAHMASIGAKGGAKERSTPRGFAANPDLARIAGRKGGRVKRRKAIDK